MSRFLSRLVVIIVGLSPLSRLIAICQVGASQSGSEALTSVREFLYLVSVENGNERFLATRRVFSSRFRQSLCTFQGESRAYTKTQRLKICWACWISGSSLGYFGTLVLNLKSVFSCDRWIASYANLLGLFK